MNILKLLLSNENIFPFLNDLGFEKAFAANTNIEKIDNILKLIYRLFLYSVVGFFAKILIKILNFK